jgi:16S rRNA (cytidine1402-2'-O)-methyltransferase
MASGTLYLIPTLLGEAAHETVLPPAVVARVRSLAAFVVEDARSARAFLKAVGVGRPLAEIAIATIDADAEPARLRQLLAPLRQGADLGLLSEAGAPGVADPGAALVRLAHAEGVRVVPLVGPSAILLALMASGLEGQRFAFHGYLPVDRSALAKRLQELERDSRRDRATQIFIETPYRNDRLLRAALDTLAPGTLLCVAADLTLAGESVATRPVSAWRDRPFEIGKRPAVFLLLAE